MNGLCARVRVRFVGLEGGAAAAAVWVSAPPGLGKRRGCAASLRDPVGVFAFCVLRFAFCVFPDKTKQPGDSFSNYKTTATLTAQLVFVLGSLLVIIDPMTPKA